MHILELRFQMGVPGCPELAARTPFMESVRMVLILVKFIPSGVGVVVGRAAMLTKNPLNSLGELSAYCACLLPEGGRLSVASHPLRCFQPRRSGAAISIR